MATLTKNQKIEALAKLVQKRSRGAGITAPPQRTVLETLMYAALLENATFDKADRAYAFLEDFYIDWNEIRVCSIRELADSLTELPHPEAAAERMRKSLQGIFEKTYMFDLEDLRKRGKALAEHIKYLESSLAGTPYMIHYAAQVALDGHLIPLDEASWRIMRRLGLAQLSNDGTQEVCIGLERVILKKSSLTFAAQLHHFAAGFYDEPDSPELLAQLSAIDPEAVERSWCSPILTSPHVSITTPTPEVGHNIKIDTPKSKPQDVIESNEPVAVREVSKELAVPKPVKPQPAPPKVDPVQVPEKPAPPKNPEKPAVQPAKKSLKPTKDAKSIPKKAVKPDVQKKSQSKESVKKSAVPKKSAKPVLPKKKVKVVAKKGPAKPSKAKKAESPSKALRKKKPK